MAKDPNLFGGKEHLHRYGIDTFEWPALPYVQQKVLDPLTIDNQDRNNSLGRDGHMTLLVLVQGPGGMRRSPQGWVERAKNEIKKGEKQGGTTQSRIGGQRLIRGSGQAFSKTLG